MDIDFLKQAIELSKKSSDEGNFPVGAVLVKDGSVVGSGISNGRFLKDATVHAETSAIRDACAKTEQREIPGSILYTSLEPCLMCYGASYWAGISKIVYAISRERVPKECFEGEHSLESINKSSNRDIEILHIAGLEEEALMILKPGLK